MITAARRSVHEGSYQDALIAIKTRKARVGVMGLGYVGLPLVRLFWKSGSPVLGFDCDPDKVDKLNNGHSYIKHIPAETVAEMLNEGRFQATADMNQLADAQVTIICVPTPLTEHKEPDMRYVVQP